MDSLMQAIADGNMANALARERELDKLRSINSELLAALDGLLAVVNVRIDDPRIAQFDAARAAIARAKGE